MNQKKQQTTNQDWDIAVTGRHVAVTDAMKQYAIDKVSKIERFNTRIIDVLVTMDIQKLEHKIDIVLKVNDFRVKSRMISNDMYAAIDGAVDKIQKQIRRYKTRLQDHRAKGLAEVDMKVNVLKPVDSVTEINDDIEEETNRRIEDELRPHQVVKQENRPLKILNNEEAVMKMELLSDYHFLVFRHEQDRRIKIIYRREDGNYGIIEPE